MKHIRKFNEGSWPTREGGGFFSSVADEIEKNVISAYDYITRETDERSGKGGYKTKWEQEQEKKYRRIAAQERQDRQNTVDDDRMSDQEYEQFLKDQLEYEWNIEFDGKEPNKTEKMEWYHNMRKQGYEGILISNFIKQIKKNKKK